MDTVTQYQQQVIESTPEKALSFLRAVATTVEIRAAMFGVGYSEAEQAQGWQLLLTATGYVPGGLTLTDDQMARTAIAELDRWDEAGFRRVHAALGRLHPEQDAFVFAGLEAQSGAGAVLSVSTLLDRLDALENGTGRAATRDADKAAIATLATRGITADVRKHLRAQVSAAQSAKPPVMDPSEISAIGSERQKALVSLRDWYKDWSETARSVIHRRDHLVVMGLAKRRTSKGDNGTTDTGVTPATAPAASPVLAPVVSPTAPVAPVAPVANGSNASA